MISAPQPAHLRHLGTLNSAVADVKGAFFSFHPVCLSSRCLGAAAAGPAAPHRRRASVSPDKHRVFYFRAPALLSRGLKHTHARAFRSLTTVSGVILWMQHCLFLYYYNHYCLTRCSFHIFSPPETIQLKTKNVHLFHYFFLISALYTI